MDTDVVSANTIAAEVACIRWWVAAGCRRISAFASTGADLYARSLMGVLRYSVGCSPDGFGDGADVNGVVVHGDGGRVGLVAPGADVPFIDFSADAVRICPRVVLARVRTVLEATQWIDRAWDEDEYITTRVEILSSVLDRLPAPDFAGFCLLPEAIYHLKDYLLPCGADWPPFGFWTSEEPREWDGVTRTVFESISTGVIVPAGISLSEEPILTISRILTV